MKDKLFTGRQGQSVTSGRQALRPPDSSDRIINALQTGIGLSSGVETASCLLPLASSTKWGHRFPCRLSLKIPFESCVAENGLRAGTGLVSFVTGLVAVPSMKPRICGCADYTFLVTRILCLVPVATSLWEQPCRMHCLSRSIPSREGRHSPSPRQQCTGQSHLITLCLFFFLFFFLTLFLRSF